MGLSGGVAVGAGKGEGRKEGGGEAEGGNNGSEYLIFLFVFASFESLGSLFVPSGRLFWLSFPPLFTSVVSPFPLPLPSLAHVPSVPSYVSPYPLPLRLHGIVPSAPHVCKFSVPCLKFAVPSVSLRL